MEPVSLTLGAIAAALVAKAAERAVEGARAFWPGSWAGCADASPATTSTSRRRRWPMSSRSLTARRCCKRWLRSSSGRQSPTPGSAPSSRRSCNTPRPGGGPREHRPDGVGQPERAKRRRGGLGDQRHLRAATASHSDMTEESAARQSVRGNRNVQIHGVLSHGDPSLRSRVAGDRRNQRLPATVRARDPPRTGWSNYTGWA